MNDGVLVAVVAAIATTIGYVIKALSERRALMKNANASDASATAVVVAAARELVDPLRKELAQERLEHSGEIAMERSKVARLRDELQAATDDSRLLRIELSKIREELSQLRSENQRYRALVAEQERRAAS